MRGQPPSNRFECAVSSIYATAIEPSRWPEALQAIADCTDDVGANLIYQRGDESLGTIVSPRLEAAQRDYAAGWWQHDIRFARLVERRYLIGSDTFTDRDVVTDEEVATHPFYVDFLGSHGLKWVVATNISPDPNIAAALAIQRSPEKARFDDGEMALFSRLARHAEKALHLGIRLIAAEMTTLAFGDALASLDVGVFVVDASAKVIVANPTAEKLLGDTLMISQDRLFARFAPEKTALQAAIDSVVGSGLSEPSATPRPVVIHGLNEDTYAVAYVLPVRLTDSHPFATVLFGARAIIVVKRSSRAEPLDPALVRDLLKVTLGEARLAALIGAGIQPREAAHRLGITEERRRERC